MDHTIVPTQPPHAVRFFGGPPLAVMIRLLFVSLVVGAVLAWLDIEPTDLVRDLVQTAGRLWATGFAAFGRAGRLIATGALVVVPIWLLIRVFNMREML